MVERSSPSSDESSLVVAKRTDSSAELHAATFDRPVHRLTAQLLSVDLARSRRNVPAAIDRSGLLAHSTVQLCAPNQRNNLHWSKCSGRL